MISWYLPWAAVVSVIVWVAVGPQLVKRQLPARRSTLANDTAQSKPHKPAGARRRSSQVGVWFAAAMLGLIGLAMLSPTIVIVAGLVAAFLPRQLDRARASRAQESALSELPNLVDLLIADVRSGLSLGDALLRLDQVTELRGAQQLVAPMTKSIRSGVPLRESFGALTSSAEPSLRLLGAGLEVLVTCGGPAAPGLQHLRHTLMGSVYSRQETRAHASQARASASVLSLAPPVFAVLAAMADSRLAAFYLFDLRGVLCVLGSLALTAVGWRWMIFLADECNRIA